MFLRKLPVNFTNVLSDLFQKAMFCPNVQLHRLHVDLSEGHEINGGSFSFLSVFDSVTCCSSSLMSYLSGLSPVAPAPPHVHSFVSPVVLEAELRIL